MVVQSRKDRWASQRDCKSHRLARWILRLRTTPAQQAPASTNPTGLPDGSFGFALLRTTESKLPGFQPSMACFSEPATWGGVSSRPRLHLPQAIGLAGLQPCANAEDCEAIRLMFKPQRTVPIQHNRTLKPMPQKIQHPCRHAGQKSNSKVFSRISP